MIACFWLLPWSAAAQVHAQAQQYPSKPVTIISDSAAGSTPDAVLRVIADRLSQSWGQQVLAVNHPGAAGSIASRIATDSPPDGYTLYIYAGPVHLRIAEGGGVQSANPAAA
jgi:tripartite-type tricarboxylate transporter receptor subunit TctC